MPVRIPATGNYILQPVSAPGRVRFKGALDFVSKLPKDVQDFFVSASCVRWIGEWPMMTIHLPWKNGTRLVGIPTDGDYSLHVLVQEFVQVFRTMRRNVDADFMHDLNCFRMNVSRGFGASALHVQKISGSRTQNSFRKMTSARIARAKNQDDRLLSLHLIAALVRLQRCQRFKQDTLLLRCWHTAPILSEAGRMFNSQIEDERVPIALGTRYREL